VDFERETLALGLVVEGALDDVDKTRERGLFRVHRHGSRLDFREVENVGDEVQEVRARTVDGTRELHLLL